jgi:hypothetical protein
VKRPAPATVAGFFMPAAAGDAILQRMVCATVKTQRSLAPRPRREFSTD